MQIDDGDPLDWTVDEVVAFLCHKTSTPWSQSTSRTPRPDLGSLEGVLRDNLVTGEVLLHDVDKETLREDFGLKALGHRSSILMAIRYLQRQSMKFQQSKLQNTSSVEDHRGVFSPSPFTSTPRPTPRPTHDRFSPIHRVSGSSYSEALAAASKTNEAARQANTHIPETAQTTPFSRHTSPRKRASVSAVAAQSGENAGSGHGTEREILDDVPLIPTQEDQSTTPSAENPRRYEQSVIDGKGRKRRRLNLNDATDRRKDGAPQNSRQIKPSDWYMGPEPLTPSQIFYSSSLNDDELEDTEFVLTGSEAPPSQRRFVNQRLQHFYQERLISLKTRDGSALYALVPYKRPGLTDSGRASSNAATSKVPYKSLMNNFKHEEFFTLYTVKDGDVKVNKERMANWPELSQSSLPTETSQTFEANRPDIYNYLLEKYPVKEEDQEVCPLYGDSGSEGEFDEETWQEIEHERSDPSQYKPAYLTSAEIDRVIQRCISEYERKWREVDQPKEEYKARKIWLIARNNFSTNQQIKGITREIDLLEERLGKLENKIKDNQYSSENELQTQCQCLEHTVVQIQKQRWYIQVLEQDQCPAKIPAPPRPTQKKRSKSKSADEESLSSETDYMSDDSMGDFIDRSDAGNQIETHLGISTPKAASPESDSEDDIISPSGIHRKSRARRHRFMDTSSSSSSTSPRSPAPPAIQPSAECIDLTRDSPAPDDLEISTPPLNPVQPNPRSMEDPFTSGRDISPLGPSLGSKVYVEIPRRRKESLELSRGQTTPLPSPSEIDEILKIPWSSFENRKDRPRLLAKLIGSLDDKERLAMTEKVEEYDAGTMQEHVKDALEALCHSLKSLKEWDKSENDLFFRTASFFIQWVNCVHLKMEGIKRQLVLTCLENTDDGFEEFFEELRRRLQNYRHWTRPIRPKIEAETEAKDTEPSDTPHKKRKREVKESQSTKNKQNTAQLRVQHQEMQKAKLEQTMGSVGISNSDPAHQPVSFGDPIIYLHPHIGRGVKPHQLQGIQFMWRELIADETRQGCLLAHTMGLGKTMQVISLLATISAAASSEDPRVREQVPEFLRRSQTLIVCPSSLIENWMEEFIMWTPTDSNIGMRRKITSSDAFGDRLRTMKDWDREGGVLLISYEMFRSFTLNKKTTKRERPLTDELHEKVKTWLLERPNIIVADEAHKMKNASTGTSQATMQFRSKSRIALTGSPLANNLVDYYTMVDWIAKDFLGDFVEFKANYVEPIEEGLYLESTHAERRKSLTKLNVLQRNLEPKVNRADISVLEGALPPKQEFFLFVPMTQLQEKLYNFFVEDITHGTKEIGNAKLWSWLAVASLCCNHPSCYRQKLIDRNEARKKLEEQIPIEGLEGLEGLDVEESLPDSERLLKEQEALFSSVPDIKAIGLSYRAVLLAKIIECTIKAGEKLLIFSHSLPTLDYIEYMLCSRRLRFCRLDGSTPVSTRQAATKKFNKGADGNQVYLISTRAGGLGLNIYGASRVVIFDFNFNPVWEEQAVGRAYRLGQQKPVFVYRFISAGTFEDIIYNKTIFKTQLAHRVVDKKNPVRSAQKAARDYLMPVKKQPKEDISEHLGKDPLVLDEILKSDTGGERMILNIKSNKTLEQREVNDKLTEQEVKDAEQELKDQRLKRTNPEAYQRLLAERQRTAMAMGQLPPMGTFAPAPPGYTQTFTHAVPSHPPQSMIPGLNRQMQQPPASIPASAHNNGPPALQPDTTAGHFFQRPSFSSPRPMAANFPPQRVSQPYHMSNVQNKAGAPHPPPQAAHSQAAPQQAAHSQAAPPQGAPPQAAPPQAAPPQAAPPQAAPPQGSSRQAPPPAMREALDFYASSNSQSQSQQPNPPPRHFQSSKPSSTAGMGGQLDGTSAMPLAEDVSESSDDETVTPNNWGRSSCKQQ